MDRQATRDIESLEAAFDLDQIYNSKELFDIVEKRNERINSKKTKTKDDLKLQKVLKNMLLLKKYRSLNNKETDMFDKWVQSCKEKDFHRSIVLRYFSFEKRVIESKIKYPDPPAVLLRKLNFTELQNLYWYITKSGSSFKNFQQIVDNLDTDYLENQKRVEAAKKLNHTSSKSTRGKKRTNTESTPKVTITTNKKNKSFKNKARNNANKPEDVIIIDSGSEAQDSDSNDQDKDENEEGDEYSIQKKPNVRTNSQVSQKHENNSDCKFNDMSERSLLKRQSARNAESNRAHGFSGNMKKDNANKQQQQKDGKVDKGNEEESAESASGRKVYVVNEDEEDSNDDEFSTFGAIFSRANLLKEHMLSKQRQQVSSHTQYSSDSSKNDNNNSNNNNNPELDDEDDPGQNGGYGTDGSLNSLFE